MFAFNPLHLNFKILVIGSLLIATLTRPFSGISAGQSHSARQEEHTTFSVPACIAWWSHDAAGYHPAMFIMLENIKGQDITGEEIPFQARFTDLRDGYVTVAREYKRTPVRNHECFTLLMRAPKSFELPIDSSLWPAMECKAMCRLVDKTSNNPQVEDLFVTHLTRITMSDEDAHAQLITQAERGLLLAQNDKTSDQKTEPSAKQDASERTSKINAKLPKYLPQVGDDFYAFEKFFGSAHEFQPAAGNSTDDLTWAHYQSRAPLYDAYAGSRNASKVDVAIVTLSAASVAKEADLLSIAKLLAGCKQNAPVTPFVHSVRYLSAGRSEIMTTAINDRRILSFPIEKNKVAVFVTRLPGDPEAALSNYIRRVDFLHLSN